MPNRLAAALAVTAILSPLAARADSWTDGQAQWARHGFQHGAWDCYGNCPDGRRPAARPARTTTRMSMMCQQNLGDGRTQISDGRLLPEGARFKIVSYRPTGREYGWSNGPCTVDVTR